MNILIPLAIATLIVFISCHGVKEEWGDYRHFLAQHRRMMKYRYSLQEAETTLTVLLIAALFLWFGVHIFGDAKKLSIWIQIGITVLLYLVFLRCFLTHRKEYHAKEFERIRSQEDARRYQIEIAEHSSNQNAEIRRLKELLHEEQNKES